MNNINEYNLFEFELNFTTTSILSTSTDSESSNDLSGGAIAGIVIGVILGLVGLGLTIFIMYKYRERWSNLITKDSTQSKKHSTIDQQTTNQSSAISYSPDHEYLTVGTSPSSNRNEQPNRKPRNNEPIYENFSQ